MNTLAATRPTPAPSSADAFTVKNTFINSSKQELAAVNSSTVLSYKKAHSSTVPWWFSKLMLKFFIVRNIRPLTQSMAMTRDNRVASSRKRVEKTAEKTFCTVLPVFRFITRTRNVVNATTPPPPPTGLLSKRSCCLV